MKKVEDEYCLADLINSIFTIYYYNRKNETYFGWCGLQVISEHKYLNPVNWQDIGVIIFSFFRLSLFMCLCSVSALAADSGQHADDNYLRFGVLPLQSPTKLASMFLPVTDYLGDRIGRPVQFVTSPNFSTFMERVKQHKYDLIYLNPLLYRRSRQFGYQAIVKVAAEPFTGILVVRKNGPIKTLSSKSLPDGVRIGFPDPDAFAATVMTRQYLEAQGIDVAKKMQVQYFVSQDSAILALHSNLVDIIGTWRPSLRSMPNDIQQDLHIIAETPAKPQMPIAVSEKLSTEVKQNIQQALIQMTSNREGARIVEQLGFNRGFEATTDTGYLKVQE
ncbi:MAG: phosphate/phosphite/phosphonate ABC transporter substrate-binding protein [Candidatus Thiodiazotropha sp. (ex Troendleina suluensis)]|nr:phosphate/phosphite/phosphonate ABC transporter substrate-binding protein [Candidatus Thiodiazotropha sp. (ex Troendleina suluensis)]